MRRRREWFEQLAESYLALWWIPAGEIPTVAEAQARVEHLREHGPTLHAFTFRAAFAAPREPGAGAVTDDDRWLCPSR